MLFPAALFERVDEIQQFGDGGAQRVKLFPDLLREGSAVCLYFLRSFPEIAGPLANISGRFVQGFRLTDQCFLCGGHEEKSLLFRFGVCLARVFRKSEEIYGAVCIYRKRNFHMHRCIVIVQGSDDGPAIEDPSECILSGRQ